MKKKKKKRGEIIMKMNRASLMAAGSGVAVIMLLVFSGFFLGKYLRPSNVVANKNNLYLANQVTLSANGPKATDKAVFMKLRYKPATANKWTETATKSMITTEDKATYQNFDINNLKKATTYEYQTQTINSSGQGGNWSEPASFATARILGTSESNVAVAFAKANNLENPGDITFDGKAENANFYVWDFGDGQKSESLVDTANTNHIYSVGGEVTATMTAYRTVSESDSILNKQTKYSGKAIVAQKKVKFFVNLPIPVIEYTEDDGLKVSLNKVSSLPQSPVALANQDQAVLGDTSCSPPNVVNFSARKNLNLKLNEKASSLTLYINKALVPKEGLSIAPIELSKSLLQAGCKESIQERKTSSQLITSYYIQCPRAVTGTIEYYWYKGKNKTDRCEKGTVNVKVGDGGEICDNAAWDMTTEGCKFSTTSCSPKLDNCKCGISNVTATQDAIEPLKYTFNIALPDSPTAKLVKIDFGDEQNQKIPIGSKADLDNLNNIVHKYTTPGVKNVLVTSYFDENAETVACGAYTLTLNPQSCSLGNPRTFTADTYNGNLPANYSTNGGTVVVTFTPPTAIGGKVLASKYKIIYGDETNSGDPTSDFDSIKTHTYSKPGLYLPAIEGFDVNNESCGTVMSLDRQINITGPATTGAGCSIGTTSLKATTVGDKTTATPQEPLEVTFTAKIAKANDIPLGTEYQMVWGDAAGVSEPIIVDENATEKTITISHKYKGPNLNPGTNGSYTAILQAVRFVDGARVNCGSVSTVVTITNVLPEGSDTGTCGFTFDSDIKAKPIKVDASKNKTVKFKSDVTVVDDKDIKQPNFWRYSFGDGGTKPIKDTTAKQLNAMDWDDVTHDYDTNGTYNVVLRGYYYGDGSVECGVLGMSQQIVVVNGKENPNATGACSIGEVTVTSKISAQDDNSKTVTISGITKVDSINIEWGYDGKNTLIEDVAGQSSITADHYYSGNGTYTVKVTGFKKNVLVTCGNQTTFTIGPLLPPPTGTDPTCNLTASPKTLTTTGSSTITWETANADSFTLDTITKELNGSMSETVSTTKTYTGTATKGTNTATCTATVTVGTTPAAATFTITTLSNQECVLSVTGGGTGTTGNTGYTTYSINQGQDMKFTGSTTNTNLKYLGFLVDGNFQAGGSYTLSNVQAHHAVNASCGIVEKGKCGIAASDTKATTKAELTTAFINGQACEDPSEPGKGRDILVNNGEDGSFDSLADKWKWSCLGTNGGSLVDCSAPK